MRRTDEDRTKLGKKLIECAKFFIGIMDYAGFESPSGKKGLGGTRVTPEQIHAYASVISDMHKLLTARCNSSANVFSTTASRCAAIVALMLGEDIDYVADLYRSLVLNKIEELPPIARSAM